MRVRLHGKEQDSKEMTGRISGSKETMVTDLTTGSVPKLLLMFAMPLFVANALQALYNLVDMIVVGQVIGGAGMSAVSIGGDIQIGRASCRERV